MRILTALSLTLVLPLAAARAQSGSLVTAGATGGSQRFTDGRVEQGAGAVVRLHLPLDMSLAATPSWGRLSNPASLGGGSASGLMDLPVELTIDHQFAGKLAPALGGGFSVTLPVGDSAAGFGSGTMGYEASLGVGVTPAPNLSLHAGAGRPLSDFSAQGALGGSGSTWAEVEGSYQLGDALSATLGLDGDLSSSDSVGASRALVVGGSYSVGALGSIVADVTRGVSGSAAQWGFSIGFGTDFANLTSLGSRSVVQRAMRALGGQSHRGGWGQGTKARKP